MHLTDFQIVFQNNTIIKLLLRMNSHILSLRTSTWYKDSHSLYDYESTKISQFNADFPISEKSIAVFRKKNNTSVIATTKPENVDTESYDLLTYFQLKPSHSPGTYRLQFSETKDFKKKTNKQERLNTDESNQSYEAKEQTYMAVCKLKDYQGNQTGYKLGVGQIVKLGRVQYFVSEVCFNGKKALAHSKHKFSNCNRKILEYTPDLHPKQVNACKICLDDEQTIDNFLLTPCKCSGSCGTVHIDCLQQWIQVKVKKQTIGGTIHFNYQKFECEVCRTELPMIIETGETDVELLPIQKPKGDYMILEAACEKSKSVMLIQNLGTEGIKLGRGHECEIRITDISVSRNHALIKHSHDGFYIFDNKSKFGTLVREEGVLSMEISNLERAVQIGRTFISMELMRKNSH